MQPDGEETMAVNEFIHSYQPVYEVMIREALSYIEEAEQADEVVDGTMDATTSATLSLSDKLKEKIKSLTSSDGELDDFRNAMYCRSLKRVHWDEVARLLIAHAKRSRRF